MVLNYKCEINDFKLVCPLTAFNRRIRRSSPLIYSGSGFSNLSIRSWYKRIMFEFLRL